MDRKHFRALLVSGLCLIGFIGITAMPASASGGAFFEKPQRFSFEFSFPDCDDQVQIHVMWNSSYGAKNVRGSDGEAFLAMETYRVSETWTDNEDNPLMTIKYSANFRETSGTLVEPTPEGTDIDGKPIVGPVYEFAAREMFQATFTLADGTRHREVARVDSTLVFDTKGDNQPGGVPITYEEQVKIANSTVSDLDICDLALSQAP